MIFINHSSALRTLNVEGGLNGESGENVANLLMNYIVRLGTLRFMWIGVIGWDRSKEEP
jgi:hypothetical protein